jgi:PTS system fructose-specific IIC component
MGVVVNLDLSAVDAVDAIQRLASGFVHAPGVVDAARLVADIQARELTLTTYVGEGVALPHARTDAVKARVVAVGRSPVGVPFGPKREAAHLIVLVGCPRAEISDYLQFSKLLLRRLRQPQVRADLMAARDADAFLKLLELVDITPAAGSARS